MSRIPPRSIERQPCDLDCTIELEASGEVLCAKVRNLSITGARIEGSEIDRCPDAFELRIAHESGAIEHLSVHCIWRSPGVVGVRFNDPEPRLRRREVFSRAF